MVIMLLAGFFALTQLNRQFFPDLDIDAVEVGTRWPGASADDVEASIIEALEPELRFLDGVDKVVSTAYEGQGDLLIEYRQGTDMQAALATVERAVSGVTTLPEDSEQPSIRQVISYDTIARLVLSGPLNESELKHYAKVIRDDLLALGIDRIRVRGSRDREISVQAKPAPLRQLDLTLDDIAQAITQSSQNVPTGDHLTGDVVRQPRVMGLARSADDIGTIEVRSTTSGHKLLVSDMATVTDGFDADQSEARRLGEQAIQLEVERALTSDALDTANRLDHYLANLPADLPDILKIEVYDFVANQIRDQISLMLRNGLCGLLLVVGILYLFLNGRAAFWIAAGIPISMMAMLAILWVNGQTINMVSLFAMIMAIGIVVDDAVVVGEHTVALREAGVDPTTAAEQGIWDMLAPVTSASLTTMASFLPLFFIGGIIGAVIQDIPLVVMAILVASLIECVFVLPCHMRSTLLYSVSQPGRWRRHIEQSFAYVRDSLFRRLLERLLVERYVTLTMAIGLLVLSVGMVTSGRLGFVFFPPPEANLIHVDVSMSPGTTRETTAAALDKIEEALYRSANEFVDNQNELIAMSFASIRDANGSLDVELIPSDRRSVQTADFLRAWQRIIPDIPDMETLTLKEVVEGPPGRELDIRLLGGHSSDDLKQAALELRAQLASIPGVSQIDDDLPYGKKEVLIELTPRGRALGFTTESIGEQLRNALHGKVAKRFPLDGEEVDVIVRLAKESVAHSDLEDFLLRTPDDHEVTLAEIATLREGSGFSRIRREDGVRRISVTAELDETTVRQEEVFALLDKTGTMSGITERYGLKNELAGRAKEQAEAFSDILIGSFLAVILIYVILAWVFASFWRPFVIMLVIPFGLIGVVIGHILMGFHLSILSLIAFLGLAGILVNDSIILVNAIDGRRQQGMALSDALVDGTCSRFRAVILTSATTIGGLSPLLFETSLQAGFLIPMAITIVFGLIVTVFLVLFVVPAMIRIQADIGGLRQRIHARLKHA